MLLQPPDQVNGKFADLGCDICSLGLQVLADDFMVSTGGLGYDFDELSIWGGYFPSDLPVAAPFEIFIYQDNAGLPGTEVCSYAAVNPTSDTLTGTVLFGVSEHLIVFSVAPCNLADGHYWLMVFTDTGTGTDDFFWETGALDPTNGVAGNLWDNTYPPVNWFAGDASELSFQITGTIVPVELQSFVVE